MLASTLLLLASACQATTQAGVATGPPAMPAGDHQDATAPQPTAPGSGGTSMQQMDPDTRFMHHMIPHHAQALVMAGLVPSRTSNPGLRLMAERIEISQKDEIALMRRWLEERGKPAPPDGDHAMHMSMPGIISDADMARLAAATGTEFDRLFLELMIRHHEGALTMVRELLGSPGAAQDSEMYRLVADIDADQRSEMARMQGMLRALPAPR